MMGDGSGKRQCLKGNGRESSRIAERQEFLRFYRSIMMPSSINKNKIIPRDTINQVPNKKNLKNTTLFHLC